MIELRLLGALDIRSGPPDHGRRGLTQPKRLALLVYLALAEPAGLHARDRLLALLWPEADDSSARHSLRNALHSLRLALGDTAIVTRGEAWVGLDFDAIHCDALELRAHLAAGRVDEALALWKGDLAPGFFLSGAPEFEHWLEAERTALSRAVRAAAWKRAEGRAGSGAAEIQAVRQAVRLDPGDEPGTRRLMRLLAAAGDRGGALVAYQDLADWFARELEAQPSAETQSLAAELHVSGPARPAQRNPDTAAPLPTPAAVPPVPHELARPKALSRRRMLGLAVVVALAGGAYLARGSAPTFDPAAEAERAVLRLPARYRADTGVYSSYLRGLNLRFQFKFAASRDTLAELVDRAPLYVPGLYGLAHAWIFLALNNLTDADEAWPRIDALARRALALDSTAASAWLALAAEDMFDHVDLARAGAHIARARALDSLDPDVPGVEATWYRFHGDMNRAVALSQEAQRLDPLSHFFARLVAKQLYFARRYEDARRAYDGLLRDFPGQLVREYPDLAQLSIAMGRPREAVEWLRLARQASGDQEGAAQLHPAATDAEAWGLVAGDARRTLAQLERRASNGEYVPAAAHARAHAALGDTTATLDWMDSMLAHRDSYLHHVRGDPAFDFVRGTGRYQEWESRTHLPPMQADQGVRPQ